MPDMINTTEQKSDSHDGELPLWAFALAAIALVRGPPGQVNNRQIAAKCEDIDPAVLRQGDGRGGAPSTPSDTPANGWKDILWRVYHNIPEHRVIAIAAGVTFYVLLAIFPGIAALVAIYGLIAAPRRSASISAIFRACCPAGPPRSSGISSRG